MTLRVDQLLLLLLHLEDRFGHFFGVCVQLVKIFPA